MNGVHELRPTVHSQHDESFRAKRQTLTEASSSRPKKKKTDSLQARICAHGGIIKLSIALPLPSDSRTSLLLKDILPCFHQLTSP